MLDIVPKTKKNIQGIWTFKYRKNKGNLKQTGENSYGKIFYFSTETSGYAIFLVKKLLKAAG